MCSGKSTIGKLLANRLGWKFLDVDEELEKVEGMSIPQIFETRGEDYFRKRELEVLMDLAKEEKLVVSTGGGLGANLQAMEFMKSSGLVVWLSIDFEAFLRRCGKNPSRPLLKKSKDELLRIFENRSEAYRKAHLKLDGTLEPYAIVEEIIHACKGSFYIL